MVERQRRFTKLAAGELHGQPASGRVAGGLPVGRGHPEAGGTDVTAGGVRTRRIIGNPFRAPSYQPVWLTSDVVALARRIYDDRAFDRLPILADALMDAGCDNDDILSHCRSEGPHARGCWVVDLVLGRSALARAGCLRLVGMTEGFEGRVWMFAEPFEIGRGRRLLADEPGNSISRLHAAVFTDGAGWWVADGGSSNGTWLSGIRLGEQPANRCGRATSSSLPKSPSGSSPPHPEAVPSQRHRRSVRSRLRDLRVLLGATAYVALQPVRCQRQCGHRPEQGERCSRSTTTRTTRSGSQMTGVVMCSSAATVRNSNDGRPSTKACRRSRSSSGRTSLGPTTGKS